MDPDPTPDPTPFFTDFKDAKFFFPYFFCNLPAGTLSLFSLKNLIFAEIFVLKFYFASIISVPFMRKGKDAEPDQYI
jgi:hypothetical protein